MAGQMEILSAIKELTNSKQLDPTELHGLLYDGIHAALAKKHGPNAAILVSQWQCDVGTANLRFELLNYDVAGTDGPFTQTNTVAPD